jgi:ParD-like antitoxin of type II bacterial toxin-antitoxin system
MPSPVKVSDRLLAMAREEAKGTHRSATAQIEHWATLGRAIEVLVAYSQVLALKRAGQALPVPTFVSRDEVHDLLARLVEDVDRETVKARIRSAGTPLYTTDPDHPGMIVEVQADGTRVVGHLEGRRFVPVGKDERSDRSER